MDNVEKLLPCPFCGESNLKFDLGGLVQCRSCAADGPMYDGQPDDEWREKAADLWNTRAQSIGVEEMREAFRVVFDHLDKGENAPGHGHEVAGVWDDNESNGENAGKPCEWCRQWAEARAALKGDSDRG